MSISRVVVLGAAGAQASAVLQGLGRAPRPLEIIACDRVFADDLTPLVGDKMLTQVTFDLLADPERLQSVLAAADVVVNCTGPYYVLGPIILDAAIAAGTSYIDICDDVDATELLLERDATSTAAGVTCLVGMGSAPGMTNVLVRLALDNLPDQDAAVDITWCVDALDMKGAVVPHFAHSFSTADPDRSTTPEWAELSPHIASFPEPVGDQLAVRLSHPEVFTLPRYTRVTAAANYGGLIPSEFTQLGWVLSRYPEFEGRSARIAAAFSDVGEPFLARHARVGSGLIVDVSVGEAGIRFISGGETSQEEATGTPAAAGVLLMLDGLVPGPGVKPAELLVPADFFAALRQVSAGGGGLQAYRTANGMLGERIRIRDLLADSVAQTGEREGVR